MAVDFDAAEFERAIKAEATLHVSAWLSRVIPSVRVQVVGVLDGIVRGSPEYTSLLGGDLRVLFGIADPGPAVETIVTAFLGSVQVRRLPAVGDSLGGIQVLILREDMSDVLGAGGSYVSRSIRRNTEVLVPWLEWLLLAGDQIIIADFEAIRGDFSGSRTGGGIMVQPKKRPSLGFRVPAEFSGVVDNNWLTRCLTQSVNPILSVFRNAAESL